MSNNDEMDEVTKSAESDLKTQQNTENDSAKEAKTSKAKTTDTNNGNSFFKKNKKVIGIVGIVVLVLLFFVIVFGNQNVEVERPHQTEVELEARLQSEVTRRVKEESAKLAEQRNQIIDRISRNFDCSAPQVFCHAQDTTEPYTTVVSSLQNFQFLPDTPYEVYIEVYPLKVDSQNAQGNQRKGSICSPNNVHLFLCQKIVMKNPALMANQIRELYALLTPSMSYRLHISGRPISATDIDLALISAEMDKLNATAANEPEVECIPPDPNTDPVAYNLYETGGMPCQEIMKDIAERKQQNQAANPQAQQPPGKEAPAQ